jgi:hypothetical protein
LKLAFLCGQISLILFLTFLLLPKIISLLNSFEASNFLLKPGNFFLQDGFFGYFLLDEVHGEGLESVPNGNQDLQLEGIINSESRLAAAGLSEVEIDLLNAFEDVGKIFREGILGDLGVKHHIISVRFVHFDSETIFSQPTLQRIAFLLRLKLLSHIRFH